MPQIDVYYVLADDSEPLEMQGELVVKDELIGKT